MSVPLESVIITAELDRRRTRAPNHAAESEALVALMRALKVPTADVLQELALAALRLCQADSAGISIAETHDGHEVFRWHAAAGQWAPFLKNTVPREASPCGTALDRNAALLMRYPETHFTYPQEGVPPLVETLLVPFEVAGEAVGTVWVIAHDESRKFDYEDLRLLRSLSEFASLAYQIADQHRQIGTALNREVAGSQVLQSISTRQIVEGDIPRLYAQVVEAAAAIMCSQFASLQMIDGKGELRLLAWKGLHAQSARFWETVRLDSSSSCGQALRGRKRFIIPDVEQSAELADTEDLTEYRRSAIRSVQSTPLLARNGEFIGVVSTHWSEPHTPSESELRIFDILARQTADLIERANAETALRQADRRKDEFLAVLAHELRNPLASLSAGIELLQRRLAKSDAADNVHSMMTRQVSHLTRLVDGLLDLSRVTRGDIDLQRAPLDMSVVIDAAIEQARPLLDGRRHQVVMELDGGPLPLYGDFERLTQVFANLLGNAAKYMDIGGRVDVRCSAEAGQAVVRVKDRGLGIPAEYLEEVFEMFSQVPEHRKQRGGGGLGIGLALSHRLIELHGGSLTAQSEGLGRGSEFVVRLPLHASAGAPAAAVSEARDVETIRRRVLVVDDNVDLAATIGEALELSGHSVEVVHDAPTALGLVESFAPDVVLIDIGLPEMDGYELAARLRAMPAGERFLLVAITGWGQKRDRDRAREAGFDEHMTKPLQLQTLEAVLARGKDKSMS